MTPRQRAFHKQASSDRAAFGYIRQATPQGVRPWRRWLAARLGVSVPRLPVCHELHYLQMCTEKLAKAYYPDGAAPTGHAAFRLFARDLPRNPAASTALGFASVGDLTRWLGAAQPVVGAMEDLAPSIADKVGKPNPEYPYPRGNPVNSPAEYPFAVEVYSHLDTHARATGRPFLTVLELMVATLPSWHL
ncbi:MAG: hypothetical protein K2X87_33955 [Gemmataceae bacterium]|nr:hypothetical protein [Gemmataceae bacterium]